jgi:hypothetical protein
MGYGFDLLRFLCSGGAGFHDALVQPVARLAPTWSKVTNAVTHCSQAGGAIARRLWGAGTMYDLRDGAIAMSLATSPIQFSLILSIMAVSCVGAGAAFAQSMPDTENGRYALQPSGDGVMRLDTRTGAVSSCSNSLSGWACYLAPDERKAMDEEIGRLQAENEKLRTQLALAAPGKSDQALPKADKQDAPKAAEGERKLEIPLPSDQDMDRVFSFLERAWQRLVDMANRMQKDASGKI